MQQEFFKRKKRTACKVTNIDNIQQDISQAEQSLDSQFQNQQPKQITNDLTEENNFKRKRPNTFKNLEDYSFISENGKNTTLESCEVDRTFVVDNVKVISHKEKKVEKLLFPNEMNSIHCPNHEISKESKINIAEATDALKTQTKSDISTLNFQINNLIESVVDKPSPEIRKMKIMNHSTRKVDIKYSLSATALFLPQNLKQLSALFKILLSVHSFNQKRGLTLIFVKYVDSIERLFKHRVEIDMLEKLNFICKESILFTPLTIFDLGEKKDTFIIDFKGCFDIDMALFNFLLEEYGNWLDKENIKGKVSKFHPDFLKENISIPQKPFLSTQCSTKSHESLMNIKEIVKNKSDNILERIKEKERLRKEQFIKECVVEKNYEDKIESLFAVSDKKALKLEDIVFSIGGFNCKSHILKSFKDKFFLKKINGVEFVVRKSEADNEL